MVNKELYDILAKKTDYTVREIRIMLDSIIETLKENIKAGEVVTIKNLGVFELEIQKATRRRDMNNGEIFDVPEKKKVIFTPSRRLNVNKVVKQTESKGEDKDVESAD